MFQLRTSWAWGLTTVSLMLAGCNGESATGGVETAPLPPTLENVDVQAHPSEGPHQGELIELGNEEYHGELLHDQQAGTITVYVLNAAADAQVPIEASEIVINAVHDNRPEQFKLAAVPDSTDPTGKSSRFVSRDGELATRLDEHGTPPQLVLTINGKSYRGEISHSHNHGHGHNRGDGQDH